MTLAVTVLPTLARIIAERGLGGTRFGTLTLSAGALVFVGVLVLAHRSAERTGRVAGWLTDGIGLHLVFGAFSLVSCPVLHLVGLDTDITLGCAMVEKFGGCWAAARLCREPSDVAISIGELMNARGLIQLIAIDVGFTADIVTPPLFTPC